MKKIKVIDNFLPEIYFNKLTGLFDQGHDKTSDSLNWFWNESSIRGDNNFMFTHLLWDTDLGRVSTYFDIFEPILYYIDKYSPVEKIKRMKLNLYEFLGHNVEGEIDKFFQNKFKLWFFSV